MNNAYLSLALVAVILAVVCYGLRGLLWRSGAVYQRRALLFTPAEQRFLRTLRGALPPGVEVFGKVRVADVLQPRDSLDQKSWRRAFVRITGKHFDFVLCDGATARLICAIELNDRSHARVDRRERDAFMVSACRDADFPLLMIPAAKYYDHEALRTWLLEALGKFPPSLPEPGAELPVCPWCGGVLQRKVARRGGQTGSRFLACSGYPSCRFTSEE